VKNLKWFQFTHKSGRKKHKRKKLQRKKYPGYGTKDLDLHTN
jgi:hypothetical protein